MGPKKQIRINVEEVPKQPQAPPPEHSLTGYGSFEYLNGNTYDGNWRIINNQKVKHGYGKLILSNFIGANRSEQSYEGNWSNDAMHGFGIYNYANGDVYRGEWKENRHQGVGKMQFGNGTFYEGQWRNHKIEGYGMLKDDLGRIWEGQFRDGGFQSRMQIQLCKQKAQEIRKTEIKGQIIEVINQMLRILENQSDEYIKQKIAPFFANKETVKEILKNTQLGFELKAKEQWLRALREAINGGYYVLRKAQESSTLGPLSLLARQQQGQGQVVEIKIKEGWLSVINVERKRWVLGQLSC